MKKYVLNAIIGMGFGFPITLLGMALIGGYNAVVQEFLVWMVASALYGVLSTIMDEKKKNYIGTFYEKSLHAVLKNYYEPDEDKQEIPIENYVADIYADGQIIEIQTRNFNVTRDKLKAFLPL